MAQPALQPDDEPALLDLARRGDREALRAVTERYWPRMRRWAWLETGDRDLAEDAVQDALVRLVRFIGLWDRERRFDTWLRAIVRNACRDRVTRRARHGREVVLVRELGVPSSLERRVDLDRAARRALAAAQHLSPRQRELLQRIDREGESPSAVARELGLTAGAVRNQLHTARKTLRARLLAEGPDVLALLEER